ncbi:hypothetical protein EJ05DRAFT_388571 [Pseudovirgaria hyperparasitica]|uniref:MARVEL domain-containing protein n=1 Tax=Pseudovirgaria hyperparasitica TaxID=470096 RepID=A0A6A6W629_9PEZI|nr:uncharacterized protein EJ05DRAFT_388571 [Pseudovirgaria hyperparasitica]KAF2757396.1 hypothetical protein EJ05DRAFT_388571 [Pseudovirgaria hyperparasitica]
MTAALLSPKCKVPLHVVYAILTVLAIGLSAPRLFMKNQPRTRANTIALGVGAKSLIILQYQLLTEHVARLRKWRSLKAFTILNSLEIVFWAAVVFLIIQANIKICVGTGCILSWIVMAIAIPLSMLAAWAAAICWVEWRAEKAVKRGIVGGGFDSRESEGETLEERRAWPKQRV